MSILKEVGDKIELTNLKRKYKTKLLKCDEFKSVGNIRKLDGALYMVGDRKVHSLDLTNKKLKIYDFKNKMWN